MGSAKSSPIYVDPSALLKLYIYEPESAAMNKWRMRNPQAVAVTHHGRAEITNGICLAAFRKQISADALTDTLNSFEEDFAEGRYAQTDFLWRATLSRCGVLSRKHTSAIGCRTLDIMHVATALELEFKRFLTFDIRQQALARAVGLKIVVPPA